MKFILNSLWTKTHFCLLAIHSVKAKVVLICIGSASRLQLHHRSRTEGQEMATSAEGSSIWEEVDRAETYLVCGMFDDAKSLATSIIRRNQTISNVSEDWGTDLAESAGMVLVQSMKHSHRTAEIMKELKALFGSATAIPVQVFITGICLQMSECPLNTVEDLLKEYLNKWRYVDGRYHPLLGAENAVTMSEGALSDFSIGADEYSEVIELYVVTLLLKPRKDVDLFISWVEKAMLPEENRQDILRRLRSLSSSKVNRSSHTSPSRQVSEDFRSDLLRNQTPSRAPALWFPPINLKLGNLRFAISSGKLLLASFLLLAFYFAKKKHATLKRVVVEKAVSMKKALVDLCQLAFSYQANPLAAVQALPTATHGSR